jgi:ornithine cyclodeaminase/alanine dehydrogenase-like protein (mu-crystallin family)
MSDGILYLRGDDVVAAMPALDERLALAERALVALVADAELPPKIGVHPRPEGAFAHAMPAALRPTRADATTADDLLGLKWVTGVPGNRAIGLPPIHAVVVLNDPATGRPSAILDGGPITAQRTAAVSGVVVRRFAPDARRVAVIGAGIQGRSHVEMLAGLLPTAELVIHDRHPERADELAAAATLPATTAETARDAVHGADVVLTAVTFARPEDRQSMTGAWLRDDALVIPVDYAAMCAADVARDASLFLTDDRGQFLANRDAGQFEGYPEPMMTIGEAIVAGAAWPAGGGRVVASHLGVGLADLVFADAIVTRAVASGLGTWLRR